MTFLLYDKLDLEEKASNKLKAWKAWHLIIYALAASFAIMNYVFLQNTMQLVDNNCVLFPRQLSFKTVDVPIENALNQNGNYNAQDFKANSTDLTERNVIDENKNDTEQNTQTTQIMDDLEISTMESRLILDTSRTLFGQDCDLAEYAPVMSLIVAATWATLFTMCPGGGRPRSGLRQPWRILAPALIFAIVMVILTGISFTKTNNGLVDFCTAFQNTTNATTCSSVDPYLERSWQASWSFGARTAATRTASAGVWASWACAVALFLIRCLAAPDFEVRRTGAYLKDPQNKLTPYLRKPRRQRSSASPTKRDTSSLKSEPTITTELVTVSIEHEQDTAPNSAQGSPLKYPMEPTVMNSSYKLD
ncbi:unnamed protein product [Pieris brassicae]|uniref:Uncharacterized protein n=1 Tax=Pieris brassicae TaxID=7116 RepID=A0A9P0XBE0_PIEBR|nr:unnamed protein product [Pieris brassicae]